MYNVLFYRDKNGKSEIIDYLDDLQKRGKSSKRDRVNREKILTYIAALAEYGTRIGVPQVKHLEGGIWELRPLSNRIFFFFWKDDTFVLLHHFIKKTQKTPKKELDNAKRKRNDFLERNGL